MIISIIQYTTVSLGDVSLSDIPGCRKFQAAEIWLATWGMETYPPLLQMTKLPLYLHPKWIAGISGFT